MLQITDDVLFPTPFHISPSLTRAKEQLPQRYVSERKNQIPDLFFDFLILMSNLPEEEMKNGEKSLQTFVLNP